MNQKIRTRASSVSAFILAGCALVMIGSGISNILHYSAGTWLEGILLLAIGLIVGIVAIKTYSLARNEKERFEELSAIIEAGKNQDFSGKPKVEILANWVYSKSEWKQFLKWEKKQANSSSLVEALSLVIMIALAIRYSTNIDWLLSFAISVMVGLAYCITKYYVNLFSINLEENKIPEVIVTNNAVIINGHSNQFLGNNLTLGKVSVNDAGKFNLLEITYGWQTKKGKTFDEIRVPIPKGSLKEAIFLQEKLSGKGVLN